MTTTRLDRQQDRQPSPSLKAEGKYETRASDLWDESCFLRTLPTKASTSASSASEKTVQDVSKAVFQRKGQRFNLFRFAAFSEEDLLLPTHQYPQKRCLEQTKRRGPQNRCGLQGPYQEERRGRKKRLQLFPCVGLRILGACELMLRAFLYPGGGETRKPPNGISPARGRTCKQAYTSPVRVPTLYQLVWRTKLCRRRPMPRVARVYDASTEAKTVFPSFSTSRKRVSVYRR